ncbi:MAG TPA: hypothetical protein VGA38_06145 [Candidatus Limnocylindria bacterium]
MRSPSTEVQRELDIAKTLLAGGDRSGATTVYQRLWDRLVASGDHFHAAVVAHMAGVVEPDDAAKHEWNIAALREADATLPREDVAWFYPSLYNNLGYSYAMRGDRAAARRSLEIALSHVDALEAGPYAEQVTKTINDRLAALDADLSSTAKD